MNHLITLAITLLVIAAPAAALPVGSLIDGGQDDAGSGRDAPDASPGAMAVDGGTHAGRLSYQTGDREDWYLVAGVPTTKPQVTVISRGGGFYAGIYTAAGAFIQNVHLATGESHTFALEHGTYRLGIGDQNGLGFAAYEFRVEYKQNDGGLARDASMAGERIGPGTYAGALIYSDGDQEDWYVIDVPPTATLRVTFTSTSGGFYGGIHRGADGSMLRNAWVSSSPRTIEAPAGAWRIGVGSHETTHGAASYAIVVEILQNDAGSGGDASQEGLAIAPGSYAGGLVYERKHDLEDWYTLHVPRGHTMTLTFAATHGGMWGGIHRADGSMVENAYSRGNLVTLDVGAGDYRIGFGSHLASYGVAAYAFDIDVVAN